MRKLALIAATGLSLGVLCLGAGAVIEAPHWHDIDWDNIHIGIDDCETVPGATATMRQFGWSGEDRITIAVPAEVSYRPNSGDRISASGDPQSLAHLRVRHRRIEMDCDGDTGNGRLNITLPGGVFRKFTLAGSGKLTLDQIDQPSLDVIIAGSGSVAATGRTDTVKLVIAGSGDAKLGQLAAKVVDVDIAGSGNAEIAPQDEARIKIAGSGDVRLFSEPKNIDTKIFGSGRIIHGTPL